MILRCRGAVARRLDSFGVQYLMGNIGTEKRPREIRGAGADASRHRDPPSVEHFDQGACSLHQFNEREGQWHVQHVSQFVEPHDGGCQSKRARESQNANRRPPECREIVTNITSFHQTRAVKIGYMSPEEAITRADRQARPTPSRFGRPTKPVHIFGHAHEGNSRQLQDSFRHNSQDDPTEQFKQVQRLFNDPANLAKIIKDLGQTEDESASGHDWLHPTAKILGQKVKVWWTRQAI